jgi:hypothetical protein
LNATTGAPVWNYTTGGGISSPAVALAGGVVFVGSDDDMVYALNATTGALVWRYTTGGYVWSSPAIAGDVVFVGSEDGTVYAFGVHNLTATSILTSKTIVGQGNANVISVKVANLGSYTENFYLTLYANTTAIIAQTGTLAIGASTTLTFQWYTTAIIEASVLTYGNYTISASVRLPSGETNNSTGQITYGTVTVTIPGDINGDGSVNGKDLHLLAQYWLETVPPAPANVDIGSYGVVGGQDLHILAQHWLE